MRYDIHRAKERHFENISDIKNTRYFTLRKINNGNWRLKSSVKNKVYSDSEIKEMKNNGIWREKS